MAIETLYPAIRPSLNLDFANARVLDPRITFGRASAATYYDGKTVAKAEENLFPQSQNFADNAWVRSECTVAAGAIAPDGTATAFKVSATSAQAYHSLRQSIAPSGLATAETAVASFFVKAAEYTKACISDLSVGRASAVFDLVTQTATLVAAPGNISASIVSIGSGWFRCSIAFSKGSANISIGIVGYPDSVPPNQYGVSYIGDGNSGIYVWGAQLEQRSSVTAYTPTTTQPITNYIPVLQTAPAGVPRFDHNPVTGESLGLLIEEQRTNWLTYSEQFDYAAWGKDAATVAVNAAVAPDGNLTADKLVENTATATHRITGGAGALSPSSGTTYTVSIYAKAGERRYLMANWHSAFNARSTFDLQTGTVASTFSGTATITSVGNGWYRCTVTGTATVNGVGTGYLHLNNSSSNSDTSYTGDGYSGIYIWGAQLEAGAFPTSYIKTEASQATRAADSAQMTGANFSSWYRQDEGTLYQDFTALGVSISDRASVRISDGGSPFSNDISLRNYAGSNKFAVFINGVVQAEIQLSPGVSAGSANRFAGVYKSNDFAAAKNGNTVGIDANGLLPVVNQLSFPSTGCNHIKRLTYYPKRLTDAQLQSLTT